MLFIVRNKHSNA